MDATTIPYSHVIRDLIDDNRTRHMDMAALYSEYCGEVPILKRKLPDALKINNILSADFRGTIIDGVTGYLFGNPITYSLDVQAYPKETEYQTCDEVLQDFLLRNSMDDLDAETGKMAAICGYTGRLLFVDKNGDERAVSIPPWECIFVENGSTEEPQYAIRYYDIEVEEGQNTTTRIKVEFYDSVNLTVFLQDSNNIFQIHEEPRPHLFDGIPLIKFVNNSELQGDFEKVSSLIDAYDLLISDAQNELEEFRNAYMVFTGVEIDSTFMQSARQSGAIQLPEGATAEFMTKTMDAEFLENQKRTLEDNIYKFSKSIDMSDEHFSGGSQSGESRKWKLLLLENRAITKERKFTKALRQMYKVLTTAWQTKGYNIDYMDIFWNFSRNIPVELLLEAEISDKLMGKVSDRTRLSVLSIVPDVEWELEEMEKERTGLINLDDLT